MGHQRVTRLFLRDSQLELTSKGELVCRFVWENVSKNNSIQAEIHSMEYTGFCRRIDHFFMADLFHIGEDIHPHKKKERST